MNWQPIARNTALEEPIRVRLAQIKNSLTEHDSPHTSWSLMDGSIGKALFFLYYYQFTKQEEDLDRAIDLVQAIDLEVILSKPYNPSFSGGLSGYFWILEHVRKYDLIDFGAEELLDILEEYLGNFLGQDLKNGNLDFLHGAVGIGAAILSRNGSANALRLAKKLIKGLDSKITVEGDYSYLPHFDFVNRVTHHDKVNLGLSHGLPNTVIFLCRAIENGLYPEQCAKMIRGMCAFMASTAVMDGSRSSIYPPLYDLNTDEQGSSRLAWCYGDLGVGYALWEAGSILKEPVFNQLALTAFQSCAARTGLTENSIADAGFCHGTGGLAYFFQKIYQITCEEQFRATAMMWLKETLLMSKFKDAPSGYKFLQGKEPKYVIDLGLLEGLTGVGLSLLASVSEQVPHWDETLSFK